MPWGSWTLPIVSCCPLTVFSRFSTEPETTFWFSIFSLCPSGCVTYIQDLADVVYRSLFPSPRLVIVVYYSPQESCPFKIPNRSVSDRIGMDLYCTAATIYVCVWVLKQSSFQPKVCGYISLQNLEIRSSRSCLIKKKVYCMLTFQLEIYKRETCLNWLHTLYINMDLQCI